MTLKNYKQKFLLTDNKTGEKFLFDLNEIDLPEKYSFVENSIDELLRLTQYTSATSVTINKADFVNRKITSVNICCLGIINLKGEE